MIKLLSTDFDGTRHWMRLRTRAVADPRSDDRVARNGHFTPKHAPRAGEVSRTLRNQNRNTLMQELDGGALGGGWHEGGLA